MFLQLLTHNWFSNLNYISATFSTACLKLKTSRTQLLQAVNDRDFLYCKISITQSQKKKFASEYLIFPSYNGFNRRYWKAICQRVSQSRI